MNPDRPDPNPMATANAEHRKPGHFERRRMEENLSLNAYLQQNVALLEKLVELAGYQQDHANQARIKPRRILFSGTAVLDSTGLWSHSSTAGNAKSIFVANFTGNGAVTVATGGRQENPPGPGAGTHLVPAGVAMTINGDTATWTLYGTAGDSLEVEIFTVPLAPSAAGSI